MGQPRDTYKYHQKVGNKIVHRGITDRPLQEREREHQEQYPSSHIEQVGIRTTRAGALRWERRGGKS